VNPVIFARTINRIGNSELKIIFGLLQTKNYIGSLLTFSNMLASDVKDPKLLSCREQLLQF
jgi:hypothetical protein